jgi:anti-sigma28 factor (negative regulator of flagellin synthesis)
MQISEPSPSIASALPAVNAAPVRPRRSPVGSPTEVAPLGPADAARPSSKVAAPSPISPDSVEISTLSQSILAEPESSPRIEALRQSYDSGTYRVNAEAVARSLVERALERIPIPAGDKAPPTRSRVPDRKSD